MKKITLEEIKKNNAKFNKLKVAEKRIAIAEDVLKLMRSQKITISRGEYFFMDNRKFKYWDNPSEIQGDLLNNKLECQVCAMGAVLLAKSRLSNSCTYKEASEDDDNIVEKLKGIFSERQLRLMEISFEGYGSNDVGIDIQNKEDELFEKAYSIYDNNAGSGTENANKRLRIIMRNIIKNNGIFKP